MIKVLVKNHFKRSKPRITNVNAKNIISYLLLGILTALILGVFGYILLILTQTFARLRLPDIYLKTVFFILLIVLTIYEIFNIIKQLYQSKDNNIYLKLPIEKEKIFLSKIIYLYLKQVVIALVFLFITAGIYGLVESDITFFYYLRLVVIGFIVPFLSLVLASLLSIPVAYLLGVVKKNKLLLIISLTVVVGAFFLLYMQFINVVLSFINLTSGSTSPIIDPIIINNLRQSVNQLYLSSLFYNLLMNEAFLVNFVIIVLIIGLLMVGAYYLLKFFYFKALNKENERIDVEIKKEIKKSKPSIAVFKKEVKTLTRNPDYAFQAIILNILMPIFIFLTIGLTYRAGEATVGKEIVPGITLLTILVFILLTNSFQGMILSREKDAHYLTKIIPVKMSKQIFAKIAFGYFLNLIMLVVTTILITSVGYISLMEGMIVLVLSLIFSTAYTFILVATDFKNPQLTSNVGGFEEGMNMYKNLFVGLFLAIIVGVIFSVTPFVRKLFLDQRVFKLFNFLVIKLDATKINYLLYGSMVIILLIYLITSAVIFKKAVKSK